MVETATIVKTKREIEYEARLDRLYGKPGEPIPTKPCDPEIVDRFRENMMKFIQSYEDGTNVDVRKALGR